MSVVDTVGKEGTIGLILILYIILVVLSFVLNRAVSGYLFPKPDRATGFLGGGGRAFRRFFPHLFLLLTHVFLLLTISFAGADMLFSDDFLYVLTLFFLVLSLIVFLLYLLIILLLIWGTWRGNANL